MDQDETWHAGRPRPWPNCIRSGPSSPPQKEQSFPVFGPCLLWPNGWMDQDGTRHAGRPRPRTHCAGWVPSSTHLKRSTASHHFLAHVCYGQTAGWIKMLLGTKVGLDLGHIVLSGDPASPKGAQPPNFRPMSIVAKRSSISAIAGHLLKSAEGYQGVLVFGFCMTTH